ncbi:MULTISPECIES: 2-hydroxyacid dehydrogenase [Brevibacillus]|jgi:glyoxylate reductase|uniref:2-hydroxyacid dehydrogenase n=1 Tax=Brevibacillus TaxID=55080 RepID=UPI0004F3848B|nr:D-glycerate dehydrogenase [Brevibacillus borstelensis]KKX54480.1 2-ketogluconate reductase [Brevibacillus borstelensis cifa_chp40]MBE5397425.1 D-glycerate dehydrogenase [Brevibacillus borstelensis]MCC0562919.1 D-glycerate dehydrogenase [Brevibacillus borstelensis]MCM3470369.1 D-glycerate dehydrogenase [Brevibacillus borstelensis]MCM3557188.1 D-glycerate dehydrogenase [Brevibacillus borstelensis]
MKKPIVFVTRQVANEAIAYVKEIATVDVWEEDRPCPREILLEKAERADGLLAMLTDRVDEELLSRAKRLKVVANMAVGYDNIDVTAAKKRGIQVTNTPDVLTEATADLTFALLMAAARRITEANRFLLAGQWTSWSPTLLAGQNVFNATLGIVGMGRIGEAVARRAKGFGMSILYCNRHRKPEAEQAVGAQYRELDDLLKQADYVVMLTPLTPDTAKMIGEREFSLMKPTSVFVNVSRGGTVDEEALYKALAEKKIWAAGLDVFQKEPVPLDHPLLTLPNVVALPHIGSATYQTRMEMAKLAAVNIRAVLEGKEPVTPV